MKQPKYLQIGDEIRMVAPSFGITTEPYMSRYAVAVKNLKRLGYKISEGPNVHRADGVVSSAPAKERAEEIMEAFASQASLIISVGGGELMDEILPYIDFDSLINSDPKWFMGFSDNTNLTFTLTILSDVITVYGPCTPSFYEKPMRLNQLDALKLLSGENHLVGYPKWNKPNFKKKKDAKPKEVDPLRRCRYMTPKLIRPFGYSAPVTGTLLGGCLDCLQALCGTKYDKVVEFTQKHPEGIIWYLEACDLTPLGIRRALFQLREAGWFNNVKMFLIGRPYCWDMNQMGVDRTNAVIDPLSEFGVPILLDVDLGHHAPSIPIKNGALATVGLNEGNIEFFYK